ncbi:MAG: SMP-30/gluconolactonase/LRE family protein [Alphaproteobacteria bacterium]|jgi:gluconolactonase|nr:SMP-30/gluconolactonase/LRE family protein [Alphaproteobacteria bacterium]
MFPPPQVIESTVFASLPEELQRTDRDSHMARDIFRGRPLGSFLEGPSFDRDGNLYVVDIAHGRVFRISPEAEFETVADYDGGPNGLKIHKDGRIFVADRYNGILEVDPVNGKVAPFVGRDDIDGYKGVNDLFFDSKGNLYFTDQGDSGLHDPTGRVFRYTTDGELQCLLDNVPSPNGLVMDPKESELYVAVTRTNSIWRVPFRADGSINRVGIFARLAGGMGPDGMAVDQEGGVIIAHAGFGAVWRFSALGVPTHKVEPCDGGLMTTNIAYGGPEGRTLYITNSFSGNVLQAEMPVAGETMFAHMD